MSDPRETADDLAAALAIVFPALLLIVVLMGILSGGLLRLLR